MTTFRITLVAALLFALAGKAHAVLIDFKAMAESGGPP